MNEGTKILSMYDGMACGMLAFLGCGITPRRYVAYEIDKYAVQTATHNFPWIEEKGDVFSGDFTQYEGFDFVIGGSPCTYWSIAQTQNRETTASGTGWDLFCQYVRAIKEAKPRFFIYENNKSMSKAIRASIDEAFGFEAIGINSALVSAQNRQRLYWVGKRNPDGTYSKVDVKQPEDRGILLKDVLDGVGAKELTEPVNVTDSGKSQTVKSQYNRNSVANFCCYSSTYGATGVGEPVRCGTYPGSKRPECDSKQYRIYDPEGKAATQCGQGGGLGAKTGLYAVPVGCSVVGRRVNAEGHRDDYNENLEHFQRVEINENPQKSRCVSTVSKDSMVCEPVGAQTIERAIPEIVDKYGCVPEMFNAYNRAEITEKAPTLSTGSMVTSSCAVNKFERCPGYYAVPCEWDESGSPTKAISGADGKTYTVYAVKDGQITIKGKSYPIKLADGYWIIRKLTVSECKRLQTVPEWYQFPVSNSQAYKMLGNGWTVEVIKHLINACKEESNE